MRSVEVIFLVVLSNNLRSAEPFNVGTMGVKIFSGPANEQFGYTVQQLTNHKGKWLLVGSPWNGYPDNRRGDVYKCQISGSKTTCDRLNLQNSVSVPSVTNVNINMSLGMTLTRIPKTNGLMTCGPLWAQQCGSQYFYPGVCTHMSPLFSVQRTQAPALQTCGGPMDLIIVLDGSNSIYPWGPMNEFLQKLIPSLDIGPHSTQVSVIQYAVDPHFEFRLNQYKTKAEVLNAASAITQKYGHSTNTFHAIDFASDFGFKAENGGRPGAAKVMVVVTDGESHDIAFSGRVLAKCEANKITRFGIAVLGSYIRNNKDPSKLIEEIKSIASKPTDNFFFNVSEEAALVKIAGTLGDRIFKIEGTVKGGDSFQMEMAQVGFSAHYSSKDDELLLGAVGAYTWSGTVVHQTGQRTDIFPFSTFQDILQDNTHHSSLLGYSVTTLHDGAVQYYVAGAPRSNHSGQVIVYTLNSQRKLTVVDSERGKQIGAYFGSVLCALDVDKNGVSDLLLVGAPMFMSNVNKEQGRVYLFSVTKGILNEQGYLDGPSISDNARFGTTISPVSDLDLDGFSDVVVGAPLEDGGKGVVYVYNGDRRTLHKQHSQRILGSRLDPKLQYFGRSLDTSGDMNDDTMPDISVGALGKVVQLWSRGVAKVTATAVFMPDKINILGTKCDVNGRKLLCVDAHVCFSASFRPKTPVGPLGIAYNFTLDADLHSSHVASRGLFRQNNDRVFSGTIQLSAIPVCKHYPIYVQDAPDFVNPLVLRVDVGLQRPDSNPVLDAYSTHAWAFSIPFSKDCGSDNVCSIDLVLYVKQEKKVLSSSPMLVSYKNRRLSFEVVVMNMKENAYNTEIIATYSKNLFYASVTPPSDGTDVKCSSVQDSLSLVCQVAYPALEKNQQVTFFVHFDFNLNHLQSKAQVDFMAQSDGKEDRPEDNKVGITVPVRYNSELILTKKSSMNFYVVEENKPYKTSIKDFYDIGPEFNLSVKVTTVNVPVGLAYLSVSLPTTTKGGNPLLYLTSLSTQPTRAVLCEASGVVDPLKIGTKPHSVSFKNENLRGMTSLDCKTVKCASIKCVIKDMTEKSHYFVNITARIWNGTFASSSFQTLELTATSEIETSQPDLLIIGLKKAVASLTISKPGEKADVPVGVIVGSAIGGLLLLALVVGLLWKFGFFKRKYKQLQKEAEGEIKAEEGL
ncbi:LOW QUALITY PROTEIN: integrin alpha-2-like [Alosa alosa]|uniref:LOW QUALITY PROTEIN: integrin alpha-2-like n=1 Tax=Alosa alosa TaxID=278164 RepID=UPI00201555E1|nr:LOW QUALITY PROTEIN: integrin alpha-2-like [Alosa alosa]